MSPSRDSSNSIDVETFVRGNTGSAALCGALLMFFGFFWFEGATGSGTFLLGDTIFHWTLRMGGLIMIAAAAWCSIGVPVALLVDALLSIFIGCLLILSTVLMATAEDLKFSYPIYLICGAIFITYGVRDLREYRKFSSPEDEDKADQDVDSFGESLEEPPFISPMQSVGEPVGKKRQSSGSPAPASDGLLGIFQKKKKTSKHR